MFLVLKPKSKINQSARAFQHADIDANVCGILDIEYLPRCAAMIQHVVVAQAQYLIVTSTYAAQQLLMLLEEYDFDQGQTTVIAIGSSTATLLHQYFTQVIVANPANSEGVLSLADLQANNSACRVKVVILKGQFGRTLIADTLLERGFEPIPIDVYKRIALNMPVFTQDFEPERIQAIIATSQDIVDAAFLHFPDNWLLSCQWVVASERIKQYLSTYHVTHISVSDGANDQALIASAQRIAIALGSENDGQRHK